MIFKKVERHSQKYVERNDCTDAYFSQWYWLELQIILLTGEMSTD